MCKVKIPRLLRPVKKKRFAIAIDIILHFQYDEHIDKQGVRIMKALAYLFLIAAAAGIIAAQPAIAVFCAILGIGFLILSGDSKKESSAPAKKNPPQPARKPAAKKPQAAVNHNRRNIQVPGAPAVDAYAYPGSQKDYFYYLLSRAFPAYSVQIDVSVQDLSGNSFHTMETVSAFDPLVTMDDGSVPVSFLLCKDGEAKLAILLGGRDDRNTAPYRMTENVLTAKGIPVQYYINTFRIKASYVYSRVSEALK